MITITDINKNTANPCICQRFFVCGGEKNVSVGKNFFLYILQQAHVLFRENLIY